MKREKKQSEHILRQMVPEPVADRLNQNETVTAEKFQECTILQSNIVGFTKLSTACSPLQVTEMLNQMFDCFDSRLELYDVYKVETIGDGYIVVSGRYSMTCTEWKPLVTDIWWYQVGIISRVQSGHHW